MIVGSGPIGATPLGCGSGAGRSSGKATVAGVGEAVEVMPRAGQVVGLGSATAICEALPVTAIKRYRPPAAAERLLRWVLPLKLQDPLLGDLAEMYADCREKFGEREARRLYWWHALRSIAPLLRQAVMRWTLIATAAEWLRRAFWG